MIRSDHKMVCDTCEKVSEYIVDNVVPALWYFYRYTMPNGYFYYMMSCSPLCTVKWEEETGIDYVERKLESLFGDYDPYQLARMKDKPTNDPMWHARDFNWDRGRPKRLCASGHWRNDADSPCSECE